MLPMEKKFENSKKLFLTNKNIEFFSLCNPQAAYKCPQNVLVHTVQPFGIFIQTFSFIMENIIYRILYAYISNLLNTVLVVINNNDKTLSYVINRN